MFSPHTKHGCCHFKGGQSTAPDLSSAVQGPEPATMEVVLVTRESLSPRQSASNNISIKWAWS